MKHFTLRKLRPLAIALGLVLCFGLFAGCSSQDGEPSQDPSQVVSESPSPSVDPSDEPSDTTDNGTANNGTNGNDDTAGVNNVVGKVTAIDGNTATLQIYSAPEGAVIESYASVDMTQYSATEETDEVDLTDAMIGLAQNGALDGADASQIAVGDMLLLSYDKDTGELLQAVIYPQDSGETDAA